MLLKRSLFRLLTGVGLALLLPVASQASERCTIADAAGIQRCRAELSATQIQDMAATQEKSQWCWAASIAMLFARYGHALSQEHIVRQYFGHVADMPVAAEAITQLLTRPWKDGEGKSFETIASVSLAQREPKSVYEAMVSELASQRPLLIGVAGHAMVLVGINFDRLPAGGGVRITGGKVIDPMPGRGLRRLFGHETRPTYLASVHVSDAAAPDKPGDTVSPSQY